MTLNFRDRKFVLGSLLQELKKAQEDRSIRTEYNLKEKRFGWNIYEQWVMLAAVNHFRIDMGKETVSDAEIICADDDAAGHVDYTQKFALNCLDLVFKD